MADHSSIEWTEATWNPIAGCSVVSPGCTNCYAMRRVAPRLAANPATPHYAGTVHPAKAGPVWTGRVNLASERTLTAPLRWARPRMIFVNSTSDLFHESVPDKAIDSIFAVMALAPQHTFQILTKRSARMRAYFADMFDAGGQFERVCNAMMLDPLLREHPSRRATYEAYGLPWRQPTCAEDWYPTSNVWLGVSVEDQARADERIPDLLATPSAVRFVSAEPLLGPIDFTMIPTGGRIGDNVVCDNALSGPADLQSGERLDWVIVGGESGTGARPMHPDWARQIRDACADTGVPFFFKQWGEWAPISSIGESDDLYHPAPDTRPDAARKCRHNNLVMHADGTIFDRNVANDIHRHVSLGAFAAGSGAMTFFEVGKKRAGRLLDGVEHNGMPIPREVPAL